MCFEHVSDDTAGIRHAATAKNTGDETQRKQRAHIRRAAHGGVKDGEGDEGGDVRRPPAHDFGEGTPEERAKDEAEDVDARDHDVRHVVVAWKVVAHRRNGCREDGAAHRDCERSHGGNDGRDPLVQRGELARVLAIDLEPGHDEGIGGRA